MDQSELLQVERQRRELEDNISKLRKSLQHWQTWEIEYEGLKEEIASLPDGSSKDDIIEIAREFKAELVDEKELQTIVGGERGPGRNQAQIIDLLEKRLDYVSKNARTIEKQLLDTRKKRNVLLLAEESDHQEDDVLPLKDIIEELDSEGNIIASKVETPGAATPHLIDVLQKVGVKDLLEQDGIVSPSAGLKQGTWEGQRELPHEQIAVPDASSDIGEPAQENGALREPAFREPPGDTTLRHRPDAGGDDRTAEARVTSTMSAKDKPTSKEPSSGPSLLQISSSTSENEKKSTSKLPGGKTELDMLPNDTPEEATLRREMVQYGLGEVGSIVAELDIEENGSDVSYDENQTALSFDSDFDEDDIEDEEESEDENGMVKHPTMSRKYLERMKELEERYGIKGMQNMGPDASKLPETVRTELDRPPAAEAARKAALARAAKQDDIVDSLPRQDKKGSLKPKKKVAFAEHLDIASDPASKSTFRNRPAALDTSEPVKALIVERQPSTAPTTTKPSTNQNQPKRPSKFKAAREATPQTPLLPPSPSSLLAPPLTNPSLATPPPQTHSNTILERDPSTNTSTSNPYPNPPSPSDPDETMHRQEIASEYYRLRNRLIQRQGGFVGDGEADNYGDEIAPLFVRDEDGTERRISRFRAARLK